MGRRPNLGTHPLSVWWVESGISEGRRKEVLKGKRKSAFALDQSGLYKLENEVFSQYLRATKNLDGIQ